MFYFYFVLILSVIVALHELGHFVAARIFGVRVEAFSIGFGPTIYRKVIGETEYRISAIPLGGYVKMLGENQHEKVEDIASFTIKSWWQRSIIAFSGPFANLLVAFIFFSLSFMVNSSYEDFLPVVGESVQGFVKGDTIVRVDGKPIQRWSQIDPRAVKFVVKRDGAQSNVELSEDFIAQPYIEPIVGEVSVGMPAYLLGMLPGDCIISLNGQNVSSWADIGKAVRSRQEMKIVFSRGKRIFSGVIMPVQDPITGRLLLGISAKMTIFPGEKLDFFSSIGKGAMSTFSAVLLNYYGLYKLLTKPSTISDSLSGPVMISQAAKNFSQKGVAPILVFIAFINVVLFVMNLLPIPVLDGGLILFAVLERLLCKPLPEKLQSGLQFLGLFALMFLMFFSIYNDADKLIDRLTNSKALSQGVK